MSKRAVWLAYSALSVGFIAISCNGSDGTTDFTGSDAGGESSADGGSAGKGGTKGGGGSDGVAGDETGSGGTHSEAGATGNAGSDAGGSPGVAGETGGGGSSDEGGSSGEGGSAGDGPIAGEPCESVKSCQEGEYCRKKGCGENELGVCVPATRAAGPVCGCDGVTYYSGALASTAGADVRATGVCNAKVARLCDEAKCELGQICGRTSLRGGSCDSKIAGVCWQLPKECPEERSEYGICEKKGCSTLCEALESGEHAIPGGPSCSLTQ